MRPEARPATRLTLEVDPRERRIQEKIRLLPDRFKSFPEGRAEIDIKVKPGAVNLLCRAARGFRGSIGLASGPPPAVEAGGAQPPPAVTARFGVTAPSF